MKVLKNLKKRIKLWVATEVFKIYFGSFLYPFEDADETYFKLPAHLKAQYLREVKDWVSSQAFRVESQGFTRKIYRDLALKPVDDVTMVAYRLALLMEQDKQKRLLAIASKFEAVGVIDETDKI